MQWIYESQPSELKDVKTIHKLTENNGNKNNILEKVQSHPNPKTSPNFAKKDYSRYRTYQKIKRNFKKVLNIRESNTIKHLPETEATEVEFEYLDQDPGRLIARLCQMRMFYGEVLKALHIMNEALNPLLLLQMTVLIISIVLNGYLVVQFIISNEENMMFFLSLTRLVVHTSSVLYLLTSSENLLNTVNIIYI